ncbi:MAG: hypothetical protein HN688_04385 [Proteobacteria bacterium]|nr:hypothetical protein [Pseudomonadota bacterium]
MHRSKLYYFLTALLTLIVAPSFAQESLSEFSQPDGFSTPKQHKVGNFQVGYELISELDLSDNIDLGPAGDEEDGYRYTGTIQATISGKVSKSDLKGTIGVQLIDQDDFDVDTHQTSTDLIADLKLRSAFSPKVTNFLSFKREEEETNDSNLIYRTKNFSTTETNTLSDRIEVGLGSHWKAAFDGALQRQSYNMTNSRDGIKRSQEQEKLFDRDNNYILLSLSNQKENGNNLYGLFQLTRSTGGSVSSEELDQDSLSIGAGIKRLSGSTKYQIELAYGKATTDSVTAGVSSQDTEETFFGRATTEFAISKKSRIYTGVVRSISVDITTSSAAAVETVPVAHIQTSVTSNVYTGIRLEYPLIELMGTGIKFENPNASLNAGYRFSPQLNLEGSVTYQQQSGNAKADSAGISAFNETEIKVFLNWMF